jgi:prepilin-type N-terminal cleavage/methylation domain-containing protein
MNTRRTAPRKAGFTLVELMVVAVIVSILAAVAVPIMTGNKKQAIATEADQALGHVRTALRAAFVQSGAYNLNLDGNPITPGLVVGRVPGISPGDLDGRYFSDASFEITLLGATTYTITATGDDSTAPQAADAVGIVLTLDETGTSTRSGL